MKPIEIREDVYWVGGVDWDLRNFHGYLTQEGSTYNAYLIVDEKITLIDTVKHYLYDEMIERISKVVNPEDIDYIVSNHVEMDHSGGLPKLMEVVKNATIITSPKGREGLKLHYKEDWDFEVANPKKGLDLGNKSLEFVLTPMVHWPDNMVTYLPEDKILFSNDAFGQHYASIERFDDEGPYDIIMKEAAKYYANIVLPYSSQVQRVLVGVVDLDIEVIAPSHGLIWGKEIPQIIDKYKKWSANEADDKVVIVYDTMWKSTEKVAYAIGDVFSENDIPVKMMNLATNHISDIMTDILNAKYLAVGSPTLNNNMLPTVAGFLTYLKGLAPKGRKAVAFGSYGWGGQSIGQIANELKEANFDVIDEIKVQYIPDNDKLDEIKENLKEEI